jgi:hypothetical protein
MYDETTLPTLPVYELAPVCTQPTDASRLARKLFAFEGSCRETEISWVVEDGERALELFKSSGAINYADGNKAFNPAYQPEDSGDELAIEAACQFLRQSDLLPEGAMPSMVRTVDSKDESNSPQFNHYRVEFSGNLALAIPGGRIQEVPLVGAHVCRVLVGGHGEIVGLSYHWPHGKVCAYARPYSPKHLRDLAGRVLGDKALDPLVEQVLTLPTLGYYVEPPAYRQGKLYPIFAYAGLPNQHLGSLFLPALDIVPVATIEAMVQDHTGEIEFVAHVEGGQPPYHYAWRATLEPSAQTGILGTQPRLRHAFIEGSHYVVLTVTDANGYTSEASSGVVRSSKTAAALSRLDIDGWVDAQTDTGCGAGMADDNDNRPEGLDEPSETDEPILYGEELDALVCDPQAIVPPTVLRLPARGAGWSMLARISPSDGMELRAVRYNNAMLAHSLSVPFYWIRTTQMPWQRGELSHPPAANPGGNCTSYLMAPGIKRVALAGGGFALVARYCITDLPAGPNSPRMLVEQRFEFRPANRTMTPAPFNLLPEAPFFPLVSYRFRPMGGNRMRVIEFDYRIDFDVAATADQCALAQEKDMPVPPIFTRLSNPVPNERSALAVGGGGRVGAAGAWDNYHQAPDYSKIALVQARILNAAAAPLFPFLRLGRLLGTVDAPNFPLPIIIPLGSIFPQDCVHIHWRWGLFLGVIPGFAPAGPAGVPMAPGQIVKVHLVRHHFGERDPQTAAALVNAEPLVGQDIVFWYQARSFVVNADTFFQHGGFFV